MPSSRRSSWLVAAVLVILPEPVLDAAQAAAASLFPADGDTAAAGLLSHSSSASRSTAPTRRPAAPGGRRRGAGTLVWAESRPRAAAGAAAAGPRRPGNLYASLLLRPQLPAGAAACSASSPSWPSATLAEALLPTGAPVSAEMAERRADRRRARSRASCWRRRPRSTARSTGWSSASASTSPAIPPIRPIPATDLQRAGAHRSPPPALSARPSPSALGRHGTRRWQRAGLCAPVRGRWLASRRGPRRADRGAARARDPARPLRRSLDETRRIDASIADGARRQITTGDVFFPQLTRGCAMLLAINANNTNVKFAVYDGDKHGRRLAHPHRTQPHGRRICASGCSQLMALAGHLKLADIDGRHHRHGRAAERCSTCACCASSTSRPSRWSSATRPSSSASRS